MEYSVTDEDSKCDVAYQLICMGCLCGGRTNKTLTDPTLIKYFKDILNDVQGSLSVSVPSPRLCWECRALLKRAFHFTQQVQECFVILQPTLLIMGTEDMSACLSGGVSRVPRLQSCRVSTVHIPTDGLVASVEEMFIPSDNKGFVPSDSEGNTPMEDEYVYEGHKEEPKQECVSMDPLDSAVKEEYQDDDGEASEILKSRFYICQDTDAIATKSKATIGDKSCKSTTCSEDFTENTVSKCNMTTYTGKPFKCSICQIRFSTNRQLTNHMRTHSEEKPNKSSVCQKYLNTGDEMKETQQHYKCSSCEKYFLQNESLKKHMKTHTSDGVPKAIRHSDTEGSPASDPSIKPNMTSAKVACISRNRQFKVFNENPYCHIVSARAISWISLSFTVLFKFLHYLE